MLHGEAAGFEDRFHVLEALLRLFIECSGKLAVRRPRALSGDVKEFAGENAGTVWADWLGGRREHDSPFAARGEQGQSQQEHKNPHVAKYIPIAANPGIFSKGQSVPLPERMPGPARGRLSACPTLVIPSPTRYAYENCL